MGKIKRIKPEAERESATSTNNLATTVTIAGLADLFNKATIGVNNDGSGVKPKTSIPANFGVETIGHISRVDVETNVSLWKRLQDGISALKNQFFRILFSLVLIYMSIQLN